MAIDDSTTYGLTGAQVKELVEEIKNGQVKYLTTDVQTRLNVYELDDGVYVLSGYDLPNLRFAPNTAMTGAGGNYQPLLLIKRNVKNTQFSVNKTFGIVFSQDTTNPLRVYAGELKTSGTTSVYTTSIPAIVNNLTSTSTTDALSANQGKTLNESKLNVTSLSGGTGISVTRTGSGANRQVTVSLATAYTPVIENYTIADTDWTALSSASPYTYSATVTATRTITSDTVTELLNTDAVAFANHSLAIGVISGQSVTFYSVGVPTASMTLKVRYTG